MNYDKTITFNPQYSKRIDKLKLKRFWLKITDNQSISKAILELRSVARIPPYHQHLESNQHFVQGKPKYLLVAPQGIFPYSVNNYLNSVNFPLPVYNLEEAKIIMSTNNTN